MERTPCIRCGDFVAPESLIVESVVLCPRCFEAPPGPAVRVEPPAKWARRIAHLVGFACGALMADLFVWDVMLPAIGPPWGVPFALLLFAVFGGFVGLVPVVGFFDEWLAERAGAACRARFLAALSLPEDGRFALVERRAPVPELGLLASSLGGFVFLGERGTRWAVPASAIESAHTVRIEGSFRARAAVAMTVRGWSERRPPTFVWLDRGSRRANKDAAFLMAVAFSLRD